MWINLTETDLEQLMAGAEYTAAKTAALGLGQPDPLPDAVTDAIQQVRGRIMACQFNYLGDPAFGELIPTELRRATLNLARYFACTRLPGGLLNAERTAEYKAALALLDKVAMCDFRMEMPVHFTPQLISGPAMSLVRVSPEVASRVQTRGI